MRARHTGHESQCDAKIKNGGQCQFRHWDAFDLKFYPYRTTPLFCNQHLRRKKLFHDVEVHDDSLAAKNILAAVNLGREVGKKGPPR
jgi:hypothetical protein